MGNFPGPWARIFPYQTGPGPGRGRPPTGSTWDFFAPCVSPTQCEAHYLFVLGALRKTRSPSPEVQTSFIFKNRAELPIFRGPSGPLLSPNPRERLGGSAPTLLWWLWGGRGTFGLQKISNVKPVSKKSKILDLWVQTYPHQVLPELVWYPVKDYIPVVSDNLGGL